MFCLTEKTVETKTSETHKESTSNSDEQSTKTILETIKKDHKHRPGKLAVFLL